MAARARPRETAQSMQNQASASEIAGYIADMAHEMERLAHGAGLQRLSELLRRAREEALRSAPE